MTPAQRRIQAANAIAAATYQNQPLTPPPIDHVWCARCDTNDYSAHCRCES